MEQKFDPVKKRPYDSRRRRERAEAKRAAILASARARFVEQGVTATTIASISEDAQVSVDTIYKAFGGKPGLVRAIVEDALAGEGPVPAEKRSDHLQATEPDPRRIIAGWGSLTVEVAPRVVPIMLMLRQAVALDEEMAALWEEVEESRLRRMTQNAANLAAPGHLRPGLSAKQAGEILWAFTGPELYERLVLRRRWSLQRYQAFITDAILAALLGVAENADR